MFLVLTLYKVIPTCRSVRNCTRQLTLRVEDNAIWPGTPSFVCFKIIHGRELLIRSRHGQAEPFVIIVCVGVSVASFCLPGLIQCTALGDSSIDSRLIVADGATGRGAGLSRFERQWVEGW